MHGYSSQPIVPLPGQGIASLDPMMTASTSPMGKALALEPGLAAQAMGKAEGGGIASLQNNRPLALNGVKQHSTVEMQKVAKQFEAIFLRMLLKEMRSTVEKSPLMGNSRAMEMFQSMQDDQFADRLSEQGIGLGDMVYRQMLGDSLRQNQRTGNPSL